MDEDRIHPDPTRLRGLRYLFTAKHHGGGSSGDARWHPDLSEADEFSVFDEADFREVMDESGNLYGVLHDRDGGLRVLGTWQQQVAEFPVANEGVPWHGYPIWAVNDEGPDNRRSERMRPTKEAFAKLEAAGLITKRQRRRLFKGDHV